MKNKFDTLKSETKDEITSWLIEMGIHNYRIQEDLSVDIDGDLNISEKKLNHLSVQFGHVSGNCLMIRNYLTSLKGAPRSVGGSFNCSHNALTSLEFAPLLCKSFYCNNNPISSFKFLPENVEKKILPLTV